MPASNVTSAAIPPDAVARVIAFDVVVTQAVLPPLFGRRNGKSADMNSTRIRARPGAGPVLFLSRDGFPSSAGIAPWDPVRRNRADWGAARTGRQPRARYGSEVR